MLANPKLLCFVQFSCIVHCASNVCMKNTTKVINSYFKYKISLAIFFSFLKVTCFLIFHKYFILQKHNSELFACGTLYWHTIPPSKQPRTHTHIEIYCSQSADECSK